MQHDLSDGKAVAPLVPRLERQRLHDMVVEHMRNLIIEAVLPPGVKLNERELCETLGISRTPLREALKVLAAEGLIEIEQNRGASVARLSETEIYELFELLGGLEALAGTLACARITDGELDEIKRQHHAMLVAKDGRDLPAYYRCNRAIHDLISGAARNGALRATYLALNRRLQALRFSSNFDPAKWDRAAREHEQMIAALEARDGPRLAEILTRHLLDARDAVLKTMAPPSAAS